MASPESSIVSEKIASAEGALLVSKQCQQNGLLCEAVMSTVEALEHIEQGLLLCADSPADSKEEHLKNLQFKANCLLDCLTRMAKSKDKEDELTTLIDLMASNDSGLAELHVVKATNYSQHDSSRNLIYSLDDGVIVVLSKIIRPRMLFFLEVRTENGEKIYTIPLREETEICIDKNRFEIQLPDYSIDGLITVRLSSPEDIQRWIELFNEYLIPYNSIEEEDVGREGAGGAAYPHGLVRGASLVSMGLKRGAEKTSQFLSWGTPFVISKLTRSESVEVSDNFRATANVAKNVTTSAASVSCRVADKIGSATMAVGSWLAPHAQVAGSKLLVHATGVSEENASETVNNVLNFTAGAVTAVATVFEGIEESVKTIGTSIGENSGKIIEHKYGTEAANVATDTFQTLGNVYTISKHTKILQPKGILKSAVKNTGKGILQEISSSSTSAVAGEEVLAVNDGQLALSVPPPPPLPMDAARAFEPALSTTESPSSFSTETPHPQRQ